MLDKDRDCYRRRIAQETAAAEGSGCAFARAVHLDLAGRYSTKLRLIELMGQCSPASPPIDSLTVG